MNLSLYVYGTSIVHKTSFLVKFISLLFLSTLLLTFPNLWLSIGALVGVLGLFKLANFKITTVLQQTKPIFPFLVLLFAFQCFFADLTLAIISTTRLLALLLFASLLTLTTKSSVIIDSIEKHLYFLRYLKINPKKVGLAISLTLRFIPVLAIITQEVKEAQKVRGLEKSIVAIAVPVIIRTLKMADDISAAIESRAFDSDD
ncbi:Energy-coupling factor transporter transmembrane protein BioN [Phocoenobacter uteri]|uniref:Energy-coupling factor transporter transmembrane protein BioN n=1 Tax=Phocoenobacter uteri TaxID=146806 RepID=A0A379CA75_9PAST|nr:energy-coupling factor transporter transmembrane component T [Phocoenobacter uteri]MDG6881010.1 hypothetical protein [Phocoenobacter uteri]SUB59028.1 Energy-coupling factor transporter transmembrane protein BioN [Phocoenobacter uteri]